MHARKRILEFICGPIDHDECEVPGVIDANARSYGTDRFVAATRPALRPWQCAQSHIQRGIVRVQSQDLPVGALFQRPLLWCEIVTDMNPKFCIEEVFNAVGVFRVLGRNLKGTGVNGR